MSPNDKKYLPSSKKTKYVYLEKYLGVKKKVIETFIEHKKLLDAMTTRQFKMEKTIRNQNSYLLGLTIATMIAFIIIVTR